MKRRRIASLTWRVFQRSSICFWDPFDWQALLKISQLLTTWCSKIIVVENDSCKELGIKSAWHCPLLWTSSHISIVCFASLISWGHLLVPCKSKLHRLSSMLCHFTTLKFKPHYLPFEWCHFTSCLWNLDNVTFLQHLKLVLRHLSSKGMFMQCQSLGSILLKTSRFCWHLWSLNENSLHLQSLVGISKILISGYSAMYPRRLSYIAFENWC